MAGFRWKPYRLSLLFLASVLGMLTPGIAATDPLPHQAAPVIVRPDLTGRSVDLSAYKGHVVLLNFWATWCAPCQVEIPRFVAWQSRYGRQGLQIIGVSMDDDAAPVRALAARRAVNYPIIMGDAEMGRQYGGILGLPVTFLIDRDGNIAAKFQGETPLAHIERDVRRLLDRP